MNPEAKTKDLILDAAEALFAEHGVPNVSVRKIVSAAGANIAAINYHFGSKDNLIRAVLHRRIEPLNDERLRRLDDLENESVPEVEEVVRAFLEPAFKIKQSGERGQKLLRIMGSVHHEGSVELRQEIAREFGEVGKRFLQALGKALPEVDRSELAWRFYFSIGSMIYSLHALAVPDELSKVLGDSSGAEERLVKFVTSGLRGEG